MSRPLQFCMMKTNLITTVFVAGGDESTPQSSQSWISLLADNRLRYLLA